jgi:hypothetical protein
MRQRAIACAGDVRSWEKDPTRFRWRGGVVNPTAYRNALRREDRANFVPVLPCLFASRIASS